MTCSADGSVHRLVADAAQQRADLRGKCALQRFLANSEIVDRRCETNEQALDEIGHRRRKGRLENRGRPALFSERSREVQRGPRGAPLGHRVGDALGQHLVVVDSLPTLRDRARALHGLVEKFFPPLRGATRASERVGGGHLGQSFRPFWKSRAG